jgi:hypothetical protein
MFLFLLGLLTGYVEQQFNKPRMGLCVAVAAKVVRHLKSLAHSRRSIGRDHPEREAIERARRAGDQIRRDLRVARRRREVGMAEQNLECQRQPPGDECETAPQRMGGDRLADPGSPARQGIGLYDLGGAKGVFPMSCRS